MTEFNPKWRKGLRLWRLRRPSQSPLNPTEVAEQPEHSQWQCQSQWHRPFSQHRPHQPVPHHSLCLPDHRQAYQLPLLIPSPQEDTDKPPATSFEFIHYTVHIPSTPYHQLIAASLSNSRSYIFAHDLHRGFNSVTEATSSRAWRSTTLPSRS